MSAYAALKDGGLKGKLIAEKPRYTEDDENMLQYANSSDDESEGKVTGSDSSLTRSVEPIGAQGQGIVYQQKRYMESNFVPNESNLRFEDKHILITLQDYENIILKGQFRLKIVSGKVKVNNCHELKPNADTVYHFTALECHSLPIISNDTDSSSSETPMVSVIEIANYETGLERIGNLHQSLKSLTFDNQNMNGIFSNYTFEPIFGQREDVQGLNIDNSWVEYFQKHMRCKEPRFMVIGGKNTGKTTFSKSMANYSVLSSKQSVVYLDLDPGQSEFSSPYCLSLHVEKSAQYCFDWTHSRAGVSHYYGFTSPMEAPTRYLEIAEILFKEYSTKYAPKRYPLIVNTPGWIKGYGREILSQLSQIIEPTFVVHLTKNVPVEPSSENPELIQNLQLQDLNVLPGSFYASKYHAAQIRSIYKLLYFHQDRNNCFDFSRYLLDHAPFRISYYVGENGAGVYAASVLNFNVNPTTFNYKNMPFLLESLIWGVYATEKENLTGQVICDNQYDSFPNIISGDEADAAKLEKKDFLGLLIVHSVNSKDRYLNVYTPHFVRSLVQKYLNNGHRILLTRGEGDIPETEMIHPTFVKERISSQSKHIPSKLKNPVDIPYVNFDLKSKVGRVWKVRRNIMRKSQSHTSS
ncbi:GRC3 [Candida oxycetoniae]|uniref:Polynucleotide 5'-hydroxyl-kinase GRC3 n=1 Tax=Candida oxycetoniae TaxID=497107 RepID=A0AAI9STF6_9ASCO|nr:GRC3 [Candida oxycetoniae]KAI3402322.2 GRC3 [Candida oxycetoniae]